MTTLFNIDWGGNRWKRFGSNIDWKIKSEFYQLHSQRLCLENGDIGSYFIFKLNKKSDCALNLVLCGFFTVTFHH